MAERPKIHIRGINAVMKSPGVTALVRKEAFKLARRAGPGFVAEMKPHRWVARAYVYTATQEAREKQASSYALQRALAGGAE